MPKRLAIVGCGGIARAHAVAAHNLGSALSEIVALVDIDGQRATEFGREFAPQAGIYTDNEQLLRECQLDAVIICTPPAMHGVMATLCLQSGIAVLCEKPLSNEVDVARHVVELARQKEVPIRTTAKYRFADGVLVAKRHLLRRTLGNIQRLEISFGAAILMEGRWNVDPLFSGGGVLMDNGPHAIDLARFLLGEMQFVDAELAHTEKYGVEEEATLELRNESGIPVSIQLSWRRPLGETFIKIEGAEGTLDLGWNSTSWHNNLGPTQLMNIAYDKNLAFSRQLQLFLHIISKGTAVEGPLELENNWYADDGLKAVEIIAAVYSR